MTASTPPSISSIFYHHYAIIVGISSTMRSTILAISLALVLPARAFDCALTASGIQYDLKPLGGLRTATHTSSTPPTSNEDRVLMSLCGDIGSEDGVSDEDKVSHLAGHYESRLMTVSSGFTCLLEDIESQVLIIRSGSSHCCHSCLAWFFGG